eukprot:3558953-Rhodomonas_salina.1
MAWQPQILFQYWRMYSEGVITVLGHATPARAFLQRFLEDPPPGALAASTTAGEGMQGGASATEVKEGKHVTCVSLHLVLLTIITVLLAILDMRITRYVTWMRRRIRGRRSLRSTSRTAEKCTSISWSTSDLGAAKKIPG